MRIISDNIRFFKLFRYLCSKIWKTLGRCELVEKRALKTYFVREIEGKDDNRVLVVDEHPELGEVYVTKEVIMPNGDVYIIFWKKSNLAKLDTSKKFVIYLP